MTQTELKRLARDLDTAEQEMYSAFKRVERLRLQVLQVMRASGKTVHPVERLRLPANSTTCR